MRHILRTLLVLLLASGAAATQPLKGVVRATDGSAIEGVAIEVVAGFTRKQLPQPTDKDGAFAFEPQALFSRDDLLAGALTLQLAKTDYRPVNRLVRATDGSFATTAAREFTMERIAGAEVLDAAERAKLEQLKSRSGRTLFLVPYNFADLAVVGNAGTINSRLKFHLKRGIVTHLQAVAAGSGLDDVEVELMPVDVGELAGERLRAYANALNALAILRGITSVDSSAGAPTVLVESEFLIIPDLPQFRPATLYVDDTLPADSLRGSARLFEQLSKLWGSSTSLALAVREAEKSLRSGDKRGLEQARTLLAAEKAQAPAGGAAIVGQIDALLLVVDRELGK